MRTGKRCIKLKYLFMMIIMMCVISGKSIDVYASTESSANVPVSYMKSESIAYPLTLEVIGEGSVFDGKESINNSVKKYLIKNELLLKKRLL